MTDETFIPAAPAAPAATVTVSGFGIGTTDEIALYISQLRDERDTAQRERDALTLELVTARRDRETMQARLNASPATVDHPLVTMLERMVENMVESHFDGPGADQLERMVDLALESALSDLSVVVDLALESALSDLSVEVECIATVST